MNKLDLTDDTFVVIRLHKTQSKKGGYSANWVSTQMVTFAKTREEALLFLLERIKNDLTT